VKARARPLSILAVRRHQAHELAAGGLPAGMHADQPLQGINNPAEGAANIIKFDLAEARVERRLTF